MTTIKQLMEADIGYKTGGFVYQVKHTHKMTEHEYEMPEHPKTIAGRPYWIHEVTLTDGKDDIKADVILQKKRKFCRLEEIKIIVVEIIPESSGGYGKKLLVREYEMITQTADEYEAQKESIPQTPAKAIPNKWDIIGRGKVKHGLLCAFIQSRAGVSDGGSICITGEDLQEIAKLADWVMSKEDIYNG